MKCPVCGGVDLQMSDRQGVEIDYCPQCRGVWLDRGELDKVIERSEGYDRSESRPDIRPDYRPDDRPGDHDRGHSKGYGHDAHKPKSIWREIFD